VGVVLNRLAPRLKNRPLKVLIPKDLPLVPSDPLLLEQVLTNLFENALRYTPAGTPLELSASAEKDTVTVTLADRGPGIPPGEEERIFGKFARGDTTGSSVGLGLTICRTIIAAHGGEIWAEHRPDGGAIFRFTLPIGGQPALPEPVETT
jgi:two-component system sensor histidine kinase KdpD